MRRLSSRQRLLVSWDHFNASYTENSDTESVLENHQEVIHASSKEQDESTLKRKRQVAAAQSPRQVQRPSIATDAFNHEVNNSLYCSQEGSMLIGRRRAVIETLSDDLQLRILEFCDASSVRKMMQVNHHYRDLIASDEAKELWWEMCHRQWTWLADEKADLVDTLHVPTSVVTSTSSSSSSSHHHDECANLALLLSLAASKKSTGVDESFFGPGALRPRYHFRNPFWSEDPAATAAVGNDMLHFRMLQMPNVGIAVQYTGRIGEGDRCIRADQPLPRPALLTYQQRRDARALSKGRSLLYCLLHLKHHRLPRVERPIWKPFVAPFAGTTSSDHPDHHVVHVTPRLIAYFEVSILSKPSEDEERLSGRSRWNQPYRATRLVPTEAEVQERVVVGLANEEFSLHGSLPGWDVNSYGYHGDTGGILHRDRQSLRPYGPPFGVGDTIGCGLDYQRRAIFFTRNGKFLGYAFKDLKLTQLKRDWYPVVGMDTNYPVSCNFGCHRPFVFDLNKMIEEERSVILHSMIIATSSSRTLSNNPKDHVLKTLFCHH